MGAIPEIRTPRPQPIAPGRRETLMALAVLLGACLLLVGLVQFARGWVDEYRGAVAARIAAEQRADRAEKQLAEMLRSGDQGVLVANIGPGLAGWQLRLVPQTNGRK